MIRDAIFKAWKQANLVGCKVTLAGLKVALPYLNEDQKDLLTPVIPLTNEVCEHFDKNIHSYGEWLHYVESPAFSNLLIKHYPNKRG